MLLFQDLAAVAFLLLHDAMSGAAEGYGVITVIASATAVVTALFIAGPCGYLPVGSRCVAIRSLPNSSPGCAWVHDRRDICWPFSGARRIRDRYDHRRGTARAMLSRTRSGPFATCLSDFFIGMGLNCHFGSFHLNGLPCWSRLAIILCGKTLIVFVVARLFGEALQTSIADQVITASRGEFSLMLLSGFLDVGYSGRGSPTSSSRLE